MSYTTIEVPVFEEYSIEISLGKGELTDFVGFGSYLVKDNNIVLKQKDNVVQIQPLTDGQREELWNILQNLKELFERLRILSEAASP